MVFTACVTVIAVWHLSGRRLSPTIAFLLSPLTIGALWQRNLEWLVIAGCAINGRWGLLLLPAKPHLCMSSVVRRGLRHPAAAVLVGSLALFTIEAYGAWFCADYGYMLSGGWNQANLWPWSIALGLIVLAVHWGNELGENVAVMLMLPYMPSYSIALLGLPLLASPRLAWVGTVGQWLLLLLWLLIGP